MNKERLATPFDIHETLKTVLNIYNAEKPVTYKDRGISLLNRIPVNRTCDSAGIALHWCTCMQQKVKSQFIQPVAYVCSRITHLHNAPFCMRPFPDCFQEFGMCAL